MNGGSGDKQPRRDSSDGGDESDEEETVEESPCGRWLKRREEVHQRNVPGIDNAFLAMDSEEGVEVVWNEIAFDVKEHLEDQEQKLRRVFENLTQLDHPNIVKFHKFWCDKTREHPRVSGRQFDVVFSEKMIILWSITPQTTDVNLGHAHCLASRAPTLDL
jgi:nuclear receptor-binding protein